MGFRKDFVWGAAAAAYQIEGGAYQDGKGLSVWDVFCEKEGAIYNGHTGETACDHYNRMPEDISLMKEIGLKAYRLSVSWPRIIPDGVGKINQKGLDFYDRLIDELLKAGIEPYVTLFHWDYPYELQCRGAWLNNDSPNWFADYTKIVVGKLSDRVSNWMTLNEPHAFILAAYQQGVFAPGLKYDDRSLLRSIHNTLLSHGKSVQAIRSNAKKKPRVTTVTAAMVKTPLTNTKEDIAAAYEAMFPTNPKNDFWANNWWLDPVYLGKYPEQAVKHLEHIMPKIGPNDMEIISQPLDYFAFNAYSSEVIKAGENGQPIVTTMPAGAAQMAVEWYIKPECLYWGAKFYQERYKLPVVVSENGLAARDWVSLDGKVHDTYRIDFLKRYLRELEHAANDDVDILGYFYWSIMDNFEWSAGYKERFGLTHVDYQTLKRTLKDSAYFYKKIIETNGEAIH